MTKQEAKDIKKSILHYLGDDFKGNQAIFDRDKGYPYFYGTDLKMVMDKVANGIYKRIEKDNEVGNDRWVLCSERMSGKEVDVQVELNNGLIFQGFIDSGCWNLGCSGLMYLPIECVDMPEEIELKVIAWRPLQQRYKGDVYESIRN